ncbi:MAG TPA: hypothetical protein VJQ49_06495 [Casimicrobiaceae bacterium]|nr:hypothetical protein [Casimicrobiaceae bacterium]
MATRRGAVAARQTVGKRDKDRAARQVAGRRDQDLSPNAARIDPYLGWAKATDFAYLGGDNAKWYPVLLELDGITAAEFWAQIGSDEADRIRVASIYQRPTRDITGLSFCTALVTRDTLVNILGNPARRLPIARFEIGPPVVPQFTPSPIAPLAPLAVFPPNAAIVAVIDDGLAFANERFRDAAGKTRFKYFWNQDDTTGINKPPGFGWGRELLETEINTLLASCTHSGIVDEEELYRRAGQDLVARRSKHGTHVMDLACGMEAQQVTPQANAPYLIGVQLPHWVTEETSGATLTPPVFDALNYILQRADQIAAQENTAPLPIVVNLSYGTIAGPHDGTSPLEQAIDEMITARATPLRVVLPAGNHYLARCHARFSMPAAPPPRVETLRWRVQPDDQSPSFAEIWLPHSGGAQPLPQVELRITTPTGVTSPWIGPGASWKWPSAANVRFYAAYFNVFAAGSRPHVLLAMAPTSQLAAAPRIAPSGTWTIEVKNTGRAIRVDAWVQRGDTPPGYPLFGRQSRFDDPRYVRFDLAGRPEEVDFGPSTILRYGSINALATGHESIVIGGFRRSDYAASRYSGAGPIVYPPGIGGPWRDGPDATAVDDDSAALHGVLAAGTRTRSICAMDGTSVAAPQITRLIAEWMTAGLASDRAAVQLEAQAVDPAPPLPPQRGGAGRIPRDPLVKERWKRWP